jgi:formylglycine-generating enzyme required for sulfatase activity
MPSGDETHVTAPNTDPAGTIVQPVQPPESDPSRTVVRPDEGASGPDSTRTVAHSGTRDTDPSGTVVSPSRQHESDPTGTVAGSVEQQARLAYTVGTTAPAPVPGFEIESELGRGGMGVVYKATQTGLGRTVALKMLIAGPYADRGLHARFLLEAESVAALEHPHIIRVFSYGESGGHPYLAMEFLPGGSLSDRLKARGPLPPHEAAELIVALAEAVAHAHSRGIVHRDIKPANVLFSAEGELRLADFGLAKVGRSDLSATGQVLGTPAYMAPEQAAGKIHEVGTAADVYALGAVLYDLLTGRPPFHGDSAMVTLQKVLTVEPNRPRALRKDIPHDLETICLKCLEKNPARRYATAEMLAADLRAFLEDRPISARPVSAAERAWKWMKRNPGRTGVIATAILVVLGGLIAANEVRKQRSEDRLAAEKHRADDRIAAEQQRQAALREAEEAAKQKQRETRAADLVDTLASADTAVVPRLIDDLKEYRDLAAPRLHELAGRPVSTKPGLHARLALVGSDSKRAAELADYVPVCRANELLTMRQFLKPQAAAVAPALWAVLTDPKAEADKRVRAACVLADLAPGDERWRQVAAGVTELVVKENPLQAVVWAQALEPVRSSLIALLMERYNSARGLIDRGKLKTPALVAEVSAFDLSANLLARYTTDRPTELAELALTVDPRHYAQFRESIRANRAAIVPVLQAELKRRALPAWAGTGEIVQPLVAIGGGAAQVDVLNPDLVIDARAQRQGYAAATLIALGEGDSAWSLLRFPTDGDPSARAYLTERLAAIGADPLALVRRFAAETDVASRRTLVLALGDYPAELVPAWEREPFVTRLLVLYRDDPDAGLHSTIDWLLRKRWGRSKEIETVDAELTAEVQRRALARSAASALPIRPLQGVMGPMLPAPRVAQKKDWFVNVEGQTYAVVRGPVEFLMGSPLTETDRVVAHEPPHRKRIKRTFAIATKEVTVEEYLRFQPKHDWEHRYSPGPDTPVVGVSWYDCAAYCNWLSAREGIPEDQWCYLPNKAGVYGPFMVVAPGYLQRTGYRLPTEFEWECACRAGTVTSRYYGRSSGLLTRYGWVYSNAETRAWPVGLLRPNDLGLFDLMGNALEWTQEPGGLYVTSQFDEMEDPNDIITDRWQTILRGGTFIGEAMFERSAVRTLTQPGNRYSSNGFRPVRTLPKQ